MATWVLLSNQLRFSNSSPIQRSLRDSPNPLMRSPSLRRNQNPPLISGHLPLMLPQIISAQEIKARFDAQDNRRNRIFGVYLAERQSLVGCVSLLLHSAHLSALSEPQTRKGKDTVHVTSWLQDAGNSIDANHGP